MSDPYSRSVPGLESPAGNAALVTPSDADVFPISSRALILASAGNVRVDMVGVGTGVTLPLVAGFNPIRVTRVYATGTAANTIYRVW